MDIVEAIEKRISCRAFTDDPIEPEKLETLAHEIKLINEESGLHFQLYVPAEDGSNISLSMKMFADNPPCYAALAGPAGAVPEEKLGYYGERLVLLATQLGLGTCWVAGTFDRSATTVELAPDEALHDVVPLGYVPEKMPLKQRTIRAGIRARSKKAEAMWQGPVALDQAPEWIAACIEAVCKAPSAVNEQPVVFVQDAPDAPIRAELSREKSGMEYTDLGIAKYHFEQVAAACGVKGTWQWGVGGTFDIA